jgi:predicted nucleotidyltransferase
LFQNNSEILHVLSFYCSLSLFSYRIRILTRTNHCRGNTAVHSCFEGGYKVTIQHSIRNLNSENNRLHQLQIIHQSEW